MKGYIVACICAGKVQKPLAEVLKEYDLPVGLFPREATNYELDEGSKKLVVNIPSVCEVTYRDQSLLRFSTKVSATLEKGKLSDVDGIKTKFILWLRVSYIYTEDSTINFSIGINRCRERKAYDFVRDGVIVDYF